MKFTAEGAEFAENCLVRSASGCSAITAVHNLGAIGFVSRMASRRAISVFGSSQPRAGEPAYALAFELGQALGRVGFDLINGAHEGTMEAVSAGGRETGASVLGVSCRMVRVVRGARVNLFVHRLIDAPTLLVRMEIMMRRAGGYVFLPGGTGTLAELGLVWEHVAKGYVSSRPMVMVGEAWRSAVAAAEERAASACLRWARNAEEVARIMVAEAVELPPAERDYTAGLELRSANV